MFKSKWSTCCCGGWSIGCGAILFAIAIAFPILISSAIKDNIVPSVAISKENEHQWTEIPGPLNITVDMNIFVYNWTNPDEVLFEGKKPQFTEIGPLPFQNIQRCLDVNYTRMQVPYETTQDERVSPLISRMSLCFTSRT